GKRGSPGAPAGPSGLGSRGPVGGDGQPSRGNACSPDAPSLGRVAPFAVTAEPHRLSTGVIAASAPRSCAGLIVRHLGTGRLKPWQPGTHEVGGREVGLRRLSGSS